MVRPEDEDESGIGGAILGRVPSQVNAARFRTAGVPAGSYEHKNFAKAEIVDGAICRTEALIMILKSARDDCLFRLADRKSRQGRQRYKPAANLTPRRQN